MMSTLVELYSQTNSHWNLPSKGGSAAHPDANKKLKWFHAFLVICSVVMLPLPAVRAIDASGVVTMVPCGNETTYGPVVALNTTFLLRDCYHSQTNTGLTVNLNSTSGALSGLSIVVENSKRVFVAVVGVGVWPPNQTNTSISNVNAVFRNVTNDVEASNSLLRVAGFSVVQTVTINMADIRHGRNLSLLAMNYLDTVIQLSVAMKNVISNSTGAVMGLQIISTALRDSTVSMTNVTSSSPLVQTTSAFDPELLVNEILVESTTITLVSCVMSGSSSNSAFAVSIRDTHMNRQSHITIIGLLVQTSTATIAGALLAQNSNVGDVYVSIANFTSISRNVVVQVVLIQNTTVDGAVIAINFALISGVTASQAFCFNILSSAVANSHLSATNVSLSTSLSTTVLYLLSVQYIATLPARSSMSNTSITLNNCAITAVLSIVVYVVNASVSTTHISITNVVMSATSQYLPIILSSLPGAADGLTLSALDSYLVGAYPVQLEVMKVVNSKIAIASSTLMIARSAYFPSNALFAFTFYDAVIANTTITITATDVVGVPSGANTGWSIGIQYCTFCSVNASLSFASLTNSGGILYVGDSILDNMTVFVAEVVRNMTVPSNFPYAPITLNRSNVVNSSSVMVTLPIEVRVADGGASSSPVVVISFLNVSVNSFVAIAGYPGSHTHLIWPNSTLHFGYSTTSINSTVVLTRIAVIPVTNDETVVVYSPAVGEAKIVVSNVSITQANSSASHDRFFLLSRSSSNVSASALVTLSLIHCTFAARWGHTALIKVKSSATDIAVTLMLDQVFLFGITSVIDAASSAPAAQGLSLVASITLRCSWWGRHSFSSPLSPIHLALCGELLRGPLSAIGTDTEVELSPNSLLAFQSPQCLVRWKPHCDGSRSVSTSFSHEASMDSTRLTFSASSATELAPHVEARTSLMTLSASTAARSTLSAVVGSLGAAASGAVLIRSSLSQQLAECASDDPGTNSSLSAALIGSSSSNLFQINAGSDANAAGYGYRGVLLSSLVIVLGSVVLLLIAAHIKHRLELRSHHPTHPVTSRTIAADFGLPGWWLAGPCAMAIAPLLSAAVSLASVSPWASGTAGDGVLVVVSLLLGCALIAWCVKALLRPRHGGWFTAVPRGPAHELLRAPRVVLWLLGGAYAWAPEPRLRTAANRRFGSAYGSLFTSMWPHRHCWFLVDMSTSIVVGFLAALPSLVVHRDDAATLIPAMCTGALHTATAVQLAFLLAFTFMRPVAVRWEYGGSLLITLLGAVGALLTSFAAEGIDGLEDVANGVAIAQMIIPILILVLGFSEDIFALLTSQPTRWRRLLHDDSKLSGPALVLSHLRSPPQKVTSTRMDRVANNSDAYKALEALIFRITEASLHDERQS
ncbi:transmembrane protein, putative [Bodo saltans]|uniref:Transmembrane protein, putative n=1 Tax=Bodo saltans TaxID=75058 RepID=A0A0S4J6V9_BODSA|nr:transmembrane protein, putative [Bodo saltans]|eukprot:CUG85815.1 transmembrane protein, putative [Bodo saltans]